MKHPNPKIEAHNKWQCIFNISIRKGRKQYIASAFAFAESFFFEMKRKELENVK